MSSESTFARISTLAASSATAPAAANTGPGTTGWTSIARRCNVQSPPLMILVGTPGSGVIEPSEPSTLPA